MGHPRKTFGTEADDRPAWSLQVRGHLVLILMQCSGEADRNIVIDGERRYLAAQRAELPEMAHVVEDEADPEAILELQLITNALREDVVPLEQVKAWERIRHSRGLSLRALGAKLEYDYSAVAKRLDLLKPSPEVHGWVDAGKLPALTAGQIVKLDHADRVVVADRFSDEGLNRPRAGEVAREVATRKTRRAGGRSPGEGKEQARPDSQAEVPGPWSTRRRDRGERLRPSRAGRGARDHHCRGSRRTGRGKSGRLRA